MKFLQTILFLIVTGLLLPCVVGAQNVSTWQEPCDSNDVGKSLRRERVSSPMAGETGSVYPLAHFYALSQGHEKLFKRKNIINYGKSVFSYSPLFEYILPQNIEQETNNSEDKYIEEDVTIKKILNNRMYNIIIVEVVRNGDMEVLLSRKILSKPRNGNKLKINDTCHIKMIPIFDLPQNLIPSIYDKGRYIINNKIVHIRYPHYAYHLNYSPDLHGLYYCPTQNE